MKEIKSVRFMENGEEIIKMSKKELEDILKSQRNFALNIEFICEKCGNKCTKAVPFSRYSFEKLFEEMDRRNGYG